MPTSDRVAAAEENDASTAALSPSLQQAFRPLPPSGGGGAVNPAPRPRRRSTLLTVCPFILGNEFCERLAFYG